MCFRNSYTKKQSVKHRVQEGAQVSMIRKLAIINIKNVEMCNKHVVQATSDVHVHCIDVPTLNWTKILFNLIIYLQFFFSDSVRVSSQRFAQ